MSNISNLFENLMMYNESSEKEFGRKRPANLMKESDETLLNLSINLPEDLTNVDPNDVEVNVGIMNVETDEEGNNETNDEETKEENVDDENNDEGEVKEESVLDSNISDKLDESDEDLDELDESKKCKDCEEEDNNKEIKKESLLKLDTQSLNKLFTSFVKENYKNIDKVVITRAMLENNKLILKGKLIKENKEVKHICFENIGFNPSKLQNTKFVMDFSEKSNLFNIMKESKKPFLATAKLVNNKLEFLNMKCDYKTRIDENKIANVTGKYILKEGLFDGKVKDFVRKEMNAISGPFNPVESNDHLGFVVQTKDKEKFETELERIGYKKVNGNWQLIKDKNKLFVTSTMSGSVTGDNQEYIFKFSARKEDIKNIK